MEFTKIFHNISTKVPEVLDIIDFVCYPKFMIYKKINKGEYVIKVEIGWHTFEVGRRPFFTFSGLPDQDFDHSVKTIREVMQPRGMACVITLSNSKTIRRAYGGYKIRQYADPNHIIY